MNIQPGFVVRIHSAEGPQGHLQVVIEAVDGLIQHIQVHQKVELPVQRAGIGLNVHRQGFASRGLGKKLNIPVVHIRALGHLAIDKDQELGILAVIPLFNLGADFHPHGLSRHFLGNGDVPPEPIVGALNSLEVSLVTLKFSFKLIAAIIDRIPVHTLAVKILPGVFAALRLLRAEEETPLILPVG